ncbi:MAG: LysR family transcriptional regulator [Candidatus Omnitrophota bacterium]
MNIKSKIWLEKDNKMVFGAGKSLILKAIKETGSINQAAKKLNMSYRHAWSYIRSIEKRLNKELVTKIKGGQGGGGAVLTPYAARLLQTFDKLERDIISIANKKFKALFLSDEIFSG